MTLPPLYAWQANAIASGANIARRAIHASPRVGKTRAAAEEYDAWALGKAPRCVVVAPLGPCPAWAAILEGMGHTVIRGYAMTAVQIRSVLLERPQNAVLVINYDKLIQKVGKTVRLVDRVIAWRPNALIVDESHRIKDPTSHWSRAVRAIGRQALWIRELTGTVAPNNYGDLWGQMTLIDDRPVKNGWRPGEDPGGWGPDFGSFRQHFLICDTMFPKRVLTHINVEQLRAMLQRDALIVRREDVFGPDSWQTVTRSIDLPPKARKVYDELAQQWIAELESEDPVAAVVRADHVLKRMVRLQQVTAGYVTDDEGVRHDVHTAKIDRVADDLSEIVSSGEKAVVFYKFRWEGAQYAARARKLCKAVWELNGDTKTEDRERIMSGFERAKGAAIAIVQTRAGGVGVSFAEARHALFVSQGFSFADEEQARDRVYKPGDARAMARCVTYYRARGTIDEFIAAAIAAKSNVHDSCRHADARAMAYGSLAGARRKRAA